LYVPRIPIQPQTADHHIRRKRLSLKMLQRDVAEQIGACEPSVFNWEANTSNPGIEYMPAIIRFLGYNPLPAADTLGGWIVRHRTSLGMTQEEAAKRLGLAPGTLVRWERGEREPAGSLLGRVERFLNDEDAAGLDARWVG
jgi:transcriptional regulator with XRE-family HTH domain